MGFSRSVFLLVIVIVASSCASLPPSRFASVRIDQYLSSHRELSPSLLRAMRAGHVVVGMDREQVRAVLGIPAKETTFRRAKVIKVWIYQGYRLHQDVVRADKAWLFRLVLVDGRLTVIEPI